MTNETLKEAIRTEISQPVEYRLGYKPDGTLVLMGYFVWRQGNDRGAEWRALPELQLT